MSGSISSIAAGSRLVDTKILLYAHDVHDPAKHDAARRLVGDLLRSGQLCLSAQVLNEFFWTATRPRKTAGGTPVLGSDDARNLVRSWAAVAHIVPVAATTTLLAMDATATHQISFWHALIWAAAKENGVSLIYTEDFQHDREVEGVRYLNPFILAAQVP